MSHRLQIVADGKYGGKTPTGEWNGMIGELTNRVRRSVDSIARLCRSIVEIFVAEYCRPI